MSSGSNDKNQNKTTIKKADQPKQLLKNDQKLHQTILDAITDGWFDWNLSDNKITFSKKFKSNLGYQADEISDHIDSLKQLLLEADYKHLMQSYEENLQQKAKAPLNTELRYLHKNGSIVWGLLRGQIIQDQNKQFCCLIAAHLDITERKQAEINLYQQANTDSLTKLPNRTHFMNQMDGFIEHAEHTGKRFAVFFINLDNFKQVNDSLGHHVGDKLLRNFTQRLSKILPSEDFLARIGGDELAILSNNFNDYSEITAMAKRCLEISTQPFELDEHKIKQSFSIGISVYPDHAGDKDELLQYANTAMYRAKQMGKHNFVYFKNKFDENRQRKDQLEIALREPVENNHFQLHFQPQYDTQTRKVVGLEALLRWNNKALDYPTPDEFIPLAELNRRIIPIGKWVLENAVKEFLDFQKHIEQDDLILSVNFSMVQFADPSIVQTVKDTLRRHSMNPGQLCIEVTETSLMEKLKSTRDALYEIHRMGIKLAIDDFGTGYSSLYYTLQMPLQYIKIDKVFVQNYDNKQESSVLKSVITLAQSLNMISIAEGVEDKDQYEFIKSLGCTVIQGFYFAKPAPLEKLIKMYKT